MNIKKIMKGMTMMKKKEKSKMENNAKKEKKEVGRKTKIEK